MGGAGHMLQRQLTLPRPRTSADPQVPCPCDQQGQVHTPAVADGMRWVSCHPGMVWHQLGSRVLPARFVHAEHAMRPCDNQR